MKDLRTGNLFAIESNLEIIRVTKDDVLKMTDRVKLLSKLISEHQSMYPDIKKWLNTKVFPGIKNEERVAYIGLNNQEPVVSAIVKRGDNSKFCHLHIQQDFQDQNIGDLFFALMAIDVKRFADEVHFTLPESLWIEKKDFFQSFGFQEVKKAYKQYRMLEEELRCSASFSTVWEKVLEKLPRIVSSFAKSRNTIFNGLLMSIKPKYLEKIRNGNKLVEIRKRFNHKWEGCRVTLYSSSPTQAIFGYATIENVKKDTPERIWSQYEGDIGVTKREFDAYTGSSNQVYAISLKNFESYLNAVDLEHISYLLNYDLKPPQSYISLKNDEHWTQAVSIAELLHNRFWLYTIRI
jgi:predicted transcriptional regulator